MKQTIQQALDDRGYSVLTPVQVAVSDPKLEGRDMLVSAQTGSGKTLGFGLAIAPAILGAQDNFEEAAEPLALVIAPTRELALQVKRELGWLYSKAGAFIASCVGGMDMRDERRALSRGTHIVVATPGRLRDHIMRETIDLSAVRAVVLDEADEMLDLGFREDLEFILGSAPEDRQTLLFSATVPASIAKLAENYQRDAERVIATSTKSQHADIEYRAYQVADRDIENGIINTLRYFEAPNAIVFANTRAMVNRLATRLTNRGFSVVALSGELSQGERAHALQSMRDGRARVCVATDVAARGIDLPNLDLVVHAELPSNSETLLHRSGRTGRAGRKGVSTLIVPPKARKKAERLIKWGKLSAAWSDAPSADQVRAKDQDRILNDDAWAVPVPDAFGELAGKLVEQFTPEQIAGAYLKLYQAKHTPPEELAEVRSERKPRGDFGPSVWFSLSGGRKANADPRRLLPMLCKAGSINKDDIGAIRIQFKETFLEIKEASVEGFLNSVGDEMSIEGNALVRLDQKPEIEDHPSKSRRPRRDRERPSGPRAVRNDGFENVPDTKRRPRRDRNDDRKGLEKRNTSNRKPEGGDERAKKTSKPKKGFENEHKSKRITKPSEPKTSKKSDPKGADLKPRKSVKATDPSVSLKPRGKGGKPKGPPPPKGKPNSKKNKARAAAKLAAHRGGNAAPRRKG